MIYFILFYFILFTYVLILYAGIDLENLITSLCLNAIVLKVSIDYKLISLICQVLAFYFKGNVVLKLDFKLLRKEFQGSFSYE